MSDSFFGLPPQFTPNAQQAKDTTDKAVVELKKTATDAFITDTMELVEIQSKSGLYQAQNDYTSVASLIDIDRAIHILAVELKYRVSHDVANKTVLIDWSNPPRVAPPSKNGVPQDINGALV